MTNTPWGERVTFLFDPKGEQVPKALHVSPFMDMQGTWCAPGGRLRARPVASIHMPCLTCVLLQPPAASPLSAPLHSLPLLTWGLSVGATVKVRLFSRQHHATLAICIRGNSCWTLGHLCAALQCHQ